MDIKRIVGAGIIAAVAALLLTFAVAVSPAAPAGGPAVIKAASVASAFAVEARKDIPHTVGKPSEAQLADLRRSWDSIPGFDLLAVAIIGLLATVGVVGFAAFKQMRI